VITVKLCCALHASHWENFLFIVDYPTEVYIRLQGFWNFIYIVCMHELKGPDKEKRLQYCRWFTHFIGGVIDILDKVFYRNETWFHRSGYVNSQNSRILSAENSHTFHDWSLHSLKVGAWCAVSRRRIIGHIVFIETITAERYQELNMNFISLLEVDEQDCWLQQDVATAHTENSTMQMLSEFLGGRIISRNLCPPRSPDLSPPDFYLWRF
jgi:hypothetical protein